MPDNNGNLIVVRGEPNPVKLIKKIIGIWGFIQKIKISCKVFVWGRMGNLP